MNIRRISRVSIWLLASLGWAGCGGAESYAEEHLSTIEFDCEQTAPCDPDFSSRMDAIEECIKDTSARLNMASESFRSMYQQRYSRCAQYTGAGCMYFHCASDAMLYSITREADLRYECQQETICAIQQGQPTAPDANDRCFADKAAKLDFASTPERAVWEMRFARCQTQQGCNYVACQ